MTLDAGAWSRQDLFGRTEQGQGLDDHIDRIRLVERLLALDMFPAEEVDAMYNLPEAELPALADLLDALEAETLSFERVLEVVGRRNIREIIGLWKKDGLALAQSFSTERSLVAHLLLKAEASEGRMGGNERKLAEIADWWESVQSTLEEIQLVSPDVLLEVCGPGAKKFLRRVENLMRTARGKEMLLEEMHSNPVMSELLGKFGVGGRYVDDRYPALTRLARAFQSAATQRGFAATADMGPRVSNFTRALKEGRLPGSLLGTPRHVAQESARALYSTGQLLGLIRP